MAPKNKKAEKMSLGDFLGDQSLGSWADEMEDAPMPRAGGGFGGASYGGGSDRPSYGGGSGFGARTDSFADRGFATREQLPLPSKPPYTAHLGNLSFDATEGDVQDFFAECEVTNVRIVEDKLDRKPKGFGYVEFGSLDGLKKALDLSGTSFQGRNVRVSVAEPPKDRPEARDISDWSRKGPLPDLPNQRRGPERGYSSRGFDAGASDAGSDRGERRRPAFESDGKQRDFGNWERKGPLSPSAEAPREGGRRFDGPREPREGGYRERQAPGWGEGRPEGERGPPRREFQPAEGRPQYERQPTAADQDNQWRSKMRADAASPSGTPEASTPSSPAPLASRPKLNLAKRTVSEAPAASPSNPSDKPNPFGAARPIDTAAREREVEEKQKQAAQQKKEAEDKAREEKKAKEAAAKEAASAKPEGDDVPETVENPEAEAKDEDANGEIVDDKEVKPQEPVVAPKDGGSWRRKSSTPAAAPAETTTQAMDEDGWSTVTKAPKSTRNNRRGGAPTRALAS